MKTAILIAMTTMMATASVGGAFARTQARDAQHATPQQAAMMDESTQTPPAYASNKWRAPVGANPYTHDLLSTDGSGR